METVTLTSAILDWVASRIGTSREELPLILARRDADRRRIAKGQLTVSQAERIAQRAKVPFGTLFLESPPEPPKVLLPDLRQTPNPEPFGEDFLEVLTDVMARHEWYKRQLLVREAPAPGFVGRFTFSQQLSPNAVAADIVSTLSLSNLDRVQSPDADAFFSRISRKAEDAGVLVMKSSFVKSNTRRTLSVSQFRGFAIADPIAPLIFVNGRDAEVATVFTLVHELAHVWLGQSGISDVQLKGSRGLERFCNMVAATVLVPAGLLLKEWERSRDVFAVAKHFRVSRYVAGIQLVELGAISQAELDAVLSRKLPAANKAPVNGLVTIPIRNSRRVTTELVSSAARGEILYRDAAALLNVQPDTVVALYQASRKGKAG